MQELIESLAFVIGEHFENRKLILKLAIVNMNKQTLRTFLGVFWLYLHDFVYFFVYVLFRVVMAGNGEIDGIHNVVFLVTGIIPWFFMNEALNVGSSSIKSYKAVLKSIKFPITIIPTIEITGIFFKRIFTFIFIFVVCGIYGYLHLFNPILFVYYLLCMLMLMYALQLFFSAFVAVSSDFQQLYIVTLRVLLFTLPIMWGYKHIAGNVILKYVVRIDPIVYILNGFRDAFVYGMPPNMLYTIYFWAFVFVFLVAGSFIQYKLRKYYADLM